MNIQKIFSSIILVGILSFFLFQITYQPRDVEKEISYKLDVSQPGIQTYKNEKWVNSSSFNSGNIQKEVYNWSDQAYVFSYGTGAYSTRGNVNNRFISLKKGLYFFDILDVTQKNTIEHESFKIDVTSPGKIFIDTTDETKTKILAFDGMVNVALISRGRQTTQLTLYPHMLFEFNQKRNNLTQKADLSRLNSLARFLYIKEIDLTQINKAFTSFVSQVYGGKNSQNIQDFLFAVFQNIGGKDDAISVKDVIFPSNLESLYGKIYIEKYKSFFYNDAKKTVYLKNKILYSLNEILSNKTVNIFEILEDFHDLETLNAKEFDEMKKIVSYYFSSALQYAGDDEIKIIFSLSNILSELNGTQKISAKMESNFYIHSIYQQLHKGIIQRSQVHEKVSEYTQKVFGENKIEFDTETNSLKRLAQTKIELGYIAFYLKNILMYDAIINNDKNLQSYTTLLKTYLAINQSLGIEKSADPNAKSSAYEAIILEHDEVLAYLLRQMITDYFEPEKQVNGLFVVKTLNISSKTFSTFNEIIEQIFDFYSQNKASVSQKNKNIDLSYQRYLILYNEYFLAASDYKKYSLTYDKTKKDLVGTLTVNENNQEEIRLDKEYLYNYFAQFSGIDTSNLGIVLHDENYFSLENFKVGDKVLSFDLYPLEGNRMQNIFINGKASTGLYRLDDFENRYKILEENFIESKEQKEPKKFSDFFIEIFLSGSNQTEQFINSSEEEDISSSILTQSSDRTLDIFKRDKLLGKNGEFSVLQGFVEFLFSEIEVKLENNKYNIFVHKAFISHANREVGVKSTLIGEYVFTNTDHYFKQPTFTFEYVGKETGKAYDGAKMVITKNINILDFKSEITKIFDFLLSRGEIGAFQSKQYVVTSLTYSQQNALTVTFLKGTMKYTAVFRINSENFTINGKTYNSQTFNDFLTNLP